MKKNIQNLIEWVFTSDKFYAGFAIVVGVANVAGLVMAILLKVKG